MPARAIDGGLVLVEYVGVVAQDVVQLFALVVEDS